jgi:hypothetical protein
MLAASSGGWIGTQSNHSFQFQTNNAERMRLDSSGNLLVGKSAADNSAGATIKPDGEGYFVKSNGSPLSANRLSTDGVIQYFFKDTSVVGSIGVADSGDRIYLAGGGAEGVGIDNGANAFVPTSETGAYKDNHMTLGRSDARFTDLYLSGGVYLGGTGSANKLDDYETGTWTPTSTATAFTTAVGTYRKIGAVVFATFNVTLPATINANFFQINGLPFTHSGTGGDNAGSVGNTDMGTNAFTLHVAGEGTSVLLRNLNDTDWLRYNAYASKNIRGGVIYRTT